MFFVKLGQYRSVKRNAIVEHKYYWFIESFEPFVELIQSIYLASGG